MTEPGSSFFSVPSMISICLLTTWTSRRCRAANPSPGAAVRCWWRARSCAAASAASSCSGVKCPRCGQAINLEILEPHSCFPIVSVFQRERHSTRSGEPGIVAVGRIFCCLSHDPCGASDFVRRRRTGAAARASPPRPGARPTPSRRTGRLARSAAGFHQARVVRHVGRVADALDRGLLEVRKFDLDEQLVARVFRRRRA